jgi:hypothetical protein
VANSWSGLRKILEEDLLCDSLHGRVQYFLTHYHNAPDNYGRFSVRVDGKEMLWANPYNETKLFNYANLLQNELGIPKRQWISGKRFLYDEENLQIENEAANMIIKDGNMDIWQITNAIKIYRNLSIHDAISSTNEVVRMFAILDRRVGKRTLQKLVYTVDEQPKWLQFFYKLRLEAEGIN